MSAGASATAAGRSTWGTGAASRAEPRVLASASGAGWGARVLHQCHPPRPAIVNATTRPTMFRTEGPLGVEGAGARDVGRGRWATRPGCSLLKITPHPAHESLPAGLSRPHLGHFTTGLLACNSRRSARNRDALIAALQLSFELIIGKTVSDHGERDHTRILRTSPRGAARSTRTISLKQLANASTSSAVMYLPRLTRTEPCTSSGVRPIAAST